jgi:hypothetical protein
MFGKFLKKKLGNEVGVVAGDIADDIVTRAADSATGGLASQADEAVKAAKRRKR